MKKTVFITGSTDGIGKLAASKFAKEDHQVIVHGRNEEKLQSTISEIKSGSGQDDIHGFVCDFSELNDIKVLTENIKNKFPQIDVLINNAGVFKSNSPTNSDGTDLRFAVNYLAPYLLTQYLLPTIQPSKDGRIINLSSAAQDTVDFDALAGKKNIPTYNSYAQSKLALTMYSFHLGNEHPDLTVIPVNPGSLLDTKMVREGFGRINGPADKGANIIYELAMSDDHKGVRGKYFDNDLGMAIGSYGDAHPDAYDSALVAKLIASTEHIIETYK